MSAGRRPLRVGVIGTGFGARVHVPAFLRDPRAEVVAVCSARPDRARAVADQHGVRGAFDDYRRMLREAEPDVVSVASPPELHAPMALAAIEHGAHVLCEKPLAPTTAAAGEMLAAAERAGRVHAVGFENRFTPPHRAATAIMQRGELGRIVCASVQVFRWPRPTFHDPAWEWLVRAERGGGMLGLWGSHYLDLLRLWLGEIEGLFCRTETAVPERELPHSGERASVTSEDTATAVIRFASGALATLSLSFAARQGGGARVEIQGTRGRLLIDEGGAVLLASGADAAALRPVRLPDDDPPVAAEPRELRPYTHLVDRFLSAIDAGGACEPSFADGYRSVAAIELCKRSQASGRWLRPGIDL